VRFGIVGIVVILLFSAIVVRLLNLQVRSGEENMAQAESIKM
jgi:cell division protein FtsI/penicillin-binding protein 2